MLMSEEIPANYKCDGGERLATGTDREDWEDREEGERSRKV